MLYLIPIEPLTERYTESWYRNIPLLFKEYTIIDGQPLIDDDIKVGTFLDINSTVNYKCVQLQKICQLFNSGKIKNGDVFFFYDLEFWGIEVVKLMAQLNNVDIKICAFLHAASYTHGDAFEVAAPYQQYTEIGWFTICDKIFVGSEYHKRAFYDRRLKNYVSFKDYDSKVVVTTNPMFSIDYKDFGREKQNLILLCNRLDEEKGVMNTLKLFERAWRSDWIFRVVTSRKTLRSNNPQIIEYLMELVGKGIVDLKYGLTKDEYHQQLARAQITVSHSPEESFGICIAESLIYGCTPMLLNNASHPEFVKYGAVLFEQQNDLQTLQSLMECRPKAWYDIDKGKLAIQHEVNLLLGEV